MSRLSLVLCFLFLFMYSGVFGGSSSSKNKHPPPPALSRRPPSSGRTPTNVWCVAKDGASEEILKGFIREACMGLDCSDIAPKRPCHFKKNIKKQASYVLNLYFVKHNTCMTQYGTITHKDPSQGGCRFPLVNLNG